MWRFAQVSVFCLILIGGALFFSLPSDVVAQSGLVPACPVGEAGCSDAYHPDNYGACELVALVNNVIRFFIGLIAVVGSIIMAYAGYLLVTSRGNVSQMERAKEMFTNILIGVILMLSAFLVVNTIMSILVGSDSSLMNWNSIECGYARQAGTATTDLPTINSDHENNVYLETGWVAGGAQYLDSIGAGGSTGSTGGGGTCSVITNPANPCAVSNLGCFGSRASDASQICNLESAGGQTKAVSGTDLCKGGESFSGGLFQINILAHYSKLPGCNSNFFTKVGSGTQGDCLQYKGPTGNQYCAIRNCTITNRSVYQACMNATFDPARNISIACSLFKNRGGNFKDWAYSAKKCGIN